MCVSVIFLLFLLCNITSQAHPPRRPRSPPKASSQQASQDSSHSSRSPSRLSTYVEVWQRTNIQTRYSVFAFHVQTLFLLFIAYLACFHTLSHSYQAILSNFSLSKSNYFFRTCSIFNPQFSFVCTSTDGLWLCRLPSNFLVSFLLVIITLVSSVCVGSRSRSNRIKSSANGSVRTHRARRMVLTKTSSMYIAICL